MAKDAADGETDVRAEIGLLLLLLKDLWHGNVAIGGGKAVGRGRLIGKAATLDIDGARYQLDSNGKLIAGDAAQLEEYIAALHQAMEKAKVSA